MKAQLYDAGTIEELPWPNTPNGAYAKRFLLPFVKSGISAYIDNIQASSLAVKAGDIVLPVVVCEASSKSSWVCSPTGQYIDYGQEYTTLIGNPLLATIVKGALHTLGKGADAARLNAVVYVNNWLFAVDLYPSGLTFEHIEAIKEAIAQRFPCHAINFRSLNKVMHRPLMESFRKSGFKMMASRYVHLTDSGDEELLKTRILKSDLKLMRETTLVVEDAAAATEEEAAEILRLYTSLYIEEHSARNPQINARYMRLLIDEGLLRFKLVKDGGRLIGAAGYMERDGVFLCPFFGYDKQDPAHNTAYRVLNTALLLEARARKLLFHQSAGGSFFKSIRRAKGCIEYHALYTRHLPLRQRVGWATLKAFINTVAPPFMKKY